MEQYSQLSEVCQRIPAEQCWDDVSKGVGGIQH